MKKKMTAALTAFAVLGGMGTGVYAGANLQEIKAYLNPSIKFKMNGQPVQLKNGSGAVVAPISYKDTTYLPVRSVSDLLGVTVKFDAATNTISLGSRQRAYQSLQVLTTCITPKIRARRSSRTRITRMSSSITPVVTEALHSCSTRTKISEALSPGSRDRRRD